MVDFNPLPYSGYVDANNHFLNSFLGGIFIRLFNSDAIWVVRFANLLAFPVFFWSIYGLRSFFREKINFYALFTLLLFSSLLIEYFGMARGYGLSLAFLMLAMQQMMVFIKEGRRFSLIVQIIAWMFAVFANLTLIPFAISAVLFSMIYSISKRNYVNFLIPLLTFPIFIYLIKYSFFLKAEGKLYYGGQDGFFENTIHSLTPYLWGFSSVYFDIFLALVFCFVLFTAVYRSSNSLRIFDPKLVFAIFLFLSVVSILAQNWFLGTNFPEDRSAIYLVIFFFGALTFAFDYWRVKYVSISIIGITISLFCLQSNFSHFQFFKYEHFDNALMTNIPSRINGIPPTTGGRFWLMDNEKGRGEEFQTYIFQEAGATSDTLLDYIVIQKDLRPSITGLYHSVFKDEISGLELFERNFFLSREKIDQTSVDIDGVNEYMDIYRKEINEAVFVRVSGLLTEMSIHKNPELIFLSKNMSTGEMNTYNGFSFVQSSYIDTEGVLKFDFTIALNTYPGRNEIHLFIQNNKKLHLKGEFKVEVYSLKN